MTSDSQGLNSRILIATVSSAADSALYRYGQMRTVLTHPNEERC